jgi:nickel-dependent lactate racemase
LNLELTIGRTTWSVAIPAERIVEGPRSVAAAPIQGIAELVRDALEKPYRFEPLRRALTPDDHVALVVDETVPNVGDAARAVLEHLASAGIAMAAVTVVFPAGSRGAWVEDLPDAFADVRTEVHDPTNRKRLAYLASTKSERRVYLNRTLVESDSVIAIGRRRFDADAGLAGGEDLFYPRFSDTETIESLRGQLRYKEATPAPDAAEVVALFGSPFFVQVIDDGERAIEVVAGLPNSLIEGVRRHDRRWRHRLPVRPDTVVATVSPDADFAELAAAAVNAARAVTKGGRIVLLAPPIEIVGEGISILRGSEDPAVARKLLTAARPDDWTACHLWTAAARRARLFLANAEEELAEELFANAIANAGELERLLSTSERILILPNAHRSIVRAGETV